MFISEKSYQRILIQLIVGVIQQLSAMMHISHCAEMVGELIAHLDMVLLHLRAHRFAAARQAINSTLVYGDANLTMPTGSELLNLMQQLIMELLRKVESTGMDELVLARLAEEQPKFLTLFKKQPCKIEDNKVLVYHCHTQPPEEIFAKFKHDDDDEDEFDLFFDDTSMENIDSSSDYSDEPEFHSIVSDLFFNAQFAFPDWAPDTKDYQIFLYSLGHNCFDFARSWLQTDSRERTSLVEEICDHESTITYPTVNVQAQYSHPGDLVSWIKYFKEQYPEHYCLKTIHYLIPIIFAYNPFITWSVGLKLPQLRPFKNPLIHAFLKNNARWLEFRKEAFQILFQKDEMPPFTMSML